MKRGGTRRLSYRRLVAAALFFMFCLGAWAGIILAARSFAGADMVDTVNREVNRVDRRYQPVEVGGDMDGVFDCEDYALLKRRKLIAAGVDRSDLTLWNVRLRNGSRHMVLEFRGVILDNLTPWAIPRDQVDYYEGWTRSAR